MEDPWTMFRCDTDVRVIYAFAEAFTRNSFSDEVQQLLDDKMIVYDHIDDIQYGPKHPKYVPLIAVQPPAYANMTKEKQETMDNLLELLVEVNGQDAYSVTSMALGTLKRDEYLVLPEKYKDIDITTPVSEVGTPWDTTSSFVTFSDFVDIYVMNKTVGEETKDPIFFGLLRAEAVKMGWVDNQVEIRYETPPADAVDTFVKDGRDIADNLDAARTTAFLIPLMAEYVFRTTGHHYLTGLADEYDRKYQAIASACLVPDITRRLRAGELWHKAMHWVGPERTRQVINALQGSPRLPNAISMRADAAPSGTAIVTTTNAVIEAMESCNWADEIEKEGGYDFDLIKDMTKTIRADVTRYHTAYFAYGVAGLDADEKDALQLAITEAQKFAPVAQGFIDAMYTDSSLGKAKALKKHADASPVLMRRATRVFRNISRTDTETIADIFNTSVKKRVAPGQATVVPTPP
jgi:hypothetical protein